MTDPFSFLESVFGGGGDGGGYSSTQGGPTLDRGFSPVVAWMIGQYFASAGPVGQYLGMVYGNPGTGIPSVTDMTPQAPGAFARRGGTGDLPARRLRDLRPRRLRDRRPRRLPRLHPGAGVPGRS